MPKKEKGILERLLSKFRRKKGGAKSKARWVTVNPEGPNRRERRAQAKAFRAMVGSREYKEIRREAEKRKLARQVKLWQEYRSGYTAEWPSSRSKTGKKLIVALPSRWGKLRKMVAREMAHA